MKEERVAFTGENGREIPAYLVLPDSGNPGLSLTRNRFLSNRLTRTMTV